MIVGIGVDVIEIDRIKKASANNSFMKKCFSETEIDLYLKDVNKLATNFAVKEAVSKVFGTGFRNFKPCDIEVLRDELGKPYINLYDNALLIKNQLNIQTLHVSSSNNKTYCTAYVIGERLNENKS